jgi:hypothetical protein
MALEPTHTTTAGLAERIASYSERLNAEHERLEAELNRDIWRYALFAVIATIVIVVGGITGFEYETRYRSANIGRRPVAVLPHDPVMVVIKPS